MNKAEMIRAMMVALCLGTCACQKQPAGQGTANTETQSVVVNQDTMTSVQGGTVTKKMP
jgi:hypothetical protein